MNFKAYVKRVIDDVMNMQVKSKPFLGMVLAILILSSFMTPLLGIPLGAMFGSYLVRK